MELAIRLAQYADTLPGLEQYAVRKFASALESFPKALADNSGLRSTSVLEKLLEAHQVSFTFRYLCKLVKKKCVAISLTQKSSKHYTFLTCRYTKCEFSS